MSFANARGQYGAPSPYVGGSPFRDSSRSLIPWLLGGVGVALGLALIGARRASNRPGLTAHEKEVRAWEEEFPGLPWYMDAVKDTRQLDLWERARDHWEKTH